MAHQYLLIESRDPFECAEVPDDYDLAAGLREAGHEVALFLVQNGVLPARPGADAALAELVGRGVDVVVDEFSLRERGIAAGALADGVRSGGMDFVLDRIAEGRRALWL